MKTTTIIFCLATVAFPFSGVPADAQNPADFDTTFNSPTGYVSPPKDEDQAVTDVVTDSAGNVFVAGVNETTAGSTGFRPFVVKIDSSGVLDTTFGNNGLFGIGDTNDSVRNIMFHQPTNRLTVVGKATQITGSFFTYNAVARLDPDTGIMDSTFGAGGQRYYSEVEGTSSHIFGDLDSSNRVLITATLPGNGSISTDNIWVGRLQAPSTPLFSDGFESGGTGAWDDVQP